MNIKTQIHYATVAPSGHNTAVDVLIQGKVN
jgi:hypothetical protein